MRASGAAVELDNGRYWLDDDGVLRCVVKPVDQTAEMALETMRLFAQLAGGKRRPVVIEMARVKGVPREVRAIYSGEHAARVWSACGLVVASSSIARTLGNFVLAVSRPAFPTRLFDDLEEALAWARNHLAKE